MKKFLVMFLLLGLFVVYFATTITVWFSWEGESEFLKIVHNFEQSHPGIHVNVVYIPKMIQKINITLASGGSFPDVALIRNDYVGILANAGVIHPVNGVNALSKIYDSFLLHGKEYAYPYYADVQVIYANKAFFKNIDLPSEDWTLSDFENIAEKLKEEKGKGVLLEEFSPYFFVSFDAAFNGGKVFQKNGVPIVNGNGTLKAAELYNSFFNIKKITVSYEKMAAINAFKTGKVGMFVMGSFLIPDFVQSGLNFTILPYPYLEKGKTIPPVLDSKGFAIFNDSEEVREFLNYVTSTQAEKEFCASTYKLPANAEAASELGKSNKLFDVMKVSEERAMILPTTKIFKVGYMRAVKTALNLYLTGKMNVKEAFEKAQEYIEARK